MDKYIRVWSSILLDTEKKLKHTFNAPASPKNIPEWYVSLKRNEKSREVTSLKLFYINANKNTYKYVVFLYAILWKHKKDMDGNIITMIDILEILVGVKHSLYNQY